MKRDLAWAMLATVSDLTQKPQPDDELWEHPDSALRSAHENVRHPIRAVEREAEHLHELADEGESPATPAILIGGVASVEAVLITVMIALAFGVAYFVTRGDDQSTTAPAFSGAGGSALGASAHGDNLSLFAPDGKLCSARQAEQTRGIDRAGACHGTSRQSGNGGPDLTTKK